MPIDPSIALGVKPIQIESPVNQLGQILQIQGAQQANQLNSLKMDEYNRGVTRQNQLRTLLSGLGNVPDDQRISALRSGGYFDEADKLEGGVLARKKTDAEVGKIGSETEIKKLEAASKRIDIAGNAFGYVMRNPTMDNAMQALDYLVQNGVYTPEQGAQYKSQVQANPQSIGQLAETAYRGALSAKDQLAKMETMNAGNRQVTQSIDPVTGKVQVLGTQDILQSADNAASTQASIENNKRSVAASYANAAASRDQAAATRDAAKIQTGFANEQGLRKEFEGLPEIKNYKQAYPAYSAIADATKRNTPQSDINIVYGLAKLYDPTSVVREGEYATVANSPNIPEKVKGYAQYLAGGGRLSTETKNQILAEAKSRIGTYEAEAKKAKSSYEGIAKKRGMDPASVFTDMGDMTAAPVAQQNPQDVQALAWANANPKDPRAAQIKQRLGAK